MNKGPMDILEDLEKEYSVAPEIAVSELKKIDQLRSDWQNSNDPAWVAFRENPRTIDLFKSAATIYRQVRLQLANDDGSLSQEERIRLHLSSRWASWYMRSLGGKPEDVRKSLEEEIASFASGAGIGSPRM